MAIWGRPVITHYNQVARLPGQDVYDARVYGAVGDGVTDDAAAIQAAINAANAAGGGVVQLRVGTYKIGAVLTAKSYVTLRGCGRRRTILNGSGLFASQLYLVSGEWLTDFRLEGLKLLSNLTDYTNDGSDRYLLRLRNSTDCHVLDVYAEGGEFGLFLYGSCTNCSIRQSEAKNCWYKGIGTNGTSSAPCRRITIDGCYSWTDQTTGEVSSGICFEETYDSTVNDCRAWQHAIGIRIENSCDNAITNSHAWENQQAGLELYNWAQRNTVSGCSCWDNNTAGHNEGVTGDPSDDNSRNVTANLSNAETKLSGISVEYGSHNNVIVGNRCWNTAAGRGLQKYGIGIGIRNLSNADQNESYNLVVGNQCFGNLGLAQTEDRGTSNTLDNNVETGGYYVRN